MAGGGLHLSGAVPVFREFVRTYQIPVVSTMMGLSVLPTEDPLNFGMVGNNGHSFGNAAVREADLVIMAGARVADRTIRDPALIETFGMLFQKGDLESSHVMNRLIQGDVGSGKTILAFLSLLIFFKVYSHYERVVVGLMGTLLIFISNMSFASSPA